MDDVRRAVRVVESERQLQFEVVVLLHCVFFGYETQVDDKPDRANQSFPLSRDKLGASDGRTASGNSLLDRQLAIQD